MKTVQNFADAALLVIDMTDEGLHGFTAREVPDMVRLVEVFIETSGIRPIFCDTNFGYRSNAKNLVQSLCAWDTPNGYSLRKTFIKAHNSAFVHSETSHGITIDSGLDSFLKRQSIQKLLICGVEASLCCLDTAVDGSKRGYDVTLLSDLTWTSKGILAKIPADLGQIHMTKSADFVM
ncbi:MAG TPA: isochorismatase family protein [Alphaproteobacteria bacterium]|nr:cysteine hydrolase [Alphaproteobacteria bacterium]HOO50696.1 isochorismatase family protein [Alphaproteobacteria bacterium]